MKDVNEMSPDEFDMYIQSQGFATSHKVADPQKMPEGLNKTNEKDVYRDMDERDDTDGFGPEYDAWEKAELVKMDNAITEKQPEKLDEMVSHINYHDEDFTQNEWRLTAKDMIEDAYSDHLQSTAEIRGDPSIYESDKSDPMTFDEFLDHPDTKKLVEALKKGPDGVGLDMHPEALEKPCEKPWWDRDLREAPTPSHDDRDR